MIEVIYKDEKQTSKGNEGDFRFPKNIRQIGLPGEEYRIYIEDYVYTFLKKIAERAAKDENGSVVVFTGETKWNAGTGYLFIKGALLAEVGEASADHVEFQDNTWQKLNEEIEQYFEGQEITGWFLTRKSLQIEVTESLQRLHMKLFGGEKVIMLMDPVEKEEAFFYYENGLMIRQSGYYIYYEKNPQMQAYMLGKNPELQPSEQENVPDDAVKTFRKIIQKKQKEEAPETEDRTSVFSYAATACLVLAVMTVGIQFYQNYSHRNAMDIITEKDSSTVSSAEVTTALEKTEKNRVTPTSALQKDPTPVPVTTAPTVAPTVSKAPLPEADTVNEENNKETDTDVISTEKEREIYREESDTRKAERRVKQEQDSETAGEQSKMTSAATGHAASYVIKPGDTLYQISIARYGTMEKVEAICKANGLTEDEIIYPGQIIVLP